MEDEQAFTVAVGGHDAAWMCSGYVTDDETQFVFRSHLPLEAPPSRRAPLAEFLARINYRLTAGAFAIDFADGEVVFRTSAVANESTLSFDLVAPVVGLNLTMTDFFLPAIVEVIEGADPAEAMQRLESDELLDGGDGRLDDA
jgi:hypothetical protein